MKSLTHFPSVINTICRTGGLKRFITRSVDSPHSAITALNNSNNFTSAQPKKRLDHLTQPVRATEGRLGVCDCQIRWGLAVDTSMGLLRWEPHHLSYSLNLKLCRVACTHEIVS